MNCESVSGFEFEFRVWGLEGYMDFVGVFCGLWIDLRRWNPPKGGKDSGRGNGRS